jgi:glycosyltransferase involved in cell wall biosynthesis
VIQTQLTGRSPELSILIPCLNEAETIGACIRAARQGAESAGALGYEIIVSDNGSTDATAQIANGEGARVITVLERGYGAALTAGIRTAQGRFVIMGDGDGSYDFSTLRPFLDQLRAGFRLVMGTRLRGEIKMGAMPWLNRRLGNPVLTLVGNILFKPGISDFHCGLRGFDRAAILDLHLATKGMEFASEMVIRARLAGMELAEVPIVYYPDGRSRPPHLRPWRDGWRHLRFMLLYSPRWVFFLPGAFLAIAGTLLTGALLTGPLRLGRITLDVHSLLASVAALIVGSQLIFLGLFARTYASRAQLLPPSPRLDRFVRAFSLELGLAVGLVLFLLGGGLFGYGLVLWGERAFGDILEYQQTLRVVIAGTAGALLGLEVFFSSFVLSLISTEEPNHTLRVEAD